MSLVDTLAMVPWTIKPLYGLISDNFPLWGMRRRPYLVAAGLAGGWWVLGGGGRLGGCRASRWVVGAGEGGEREGQKGDDKGRRGGHHGLVCRKVFFL
jgi:hypothetical protein